MDVPPAVRAKALAAGADAWLRELPERIAVLEREWSIRAGAVLGGGTEAYVAEARAEDGTAAVLKLLVPAVEGAAANEITALRLAAGRGCARLLRADVGAGALLLERLGRPLGALGLPIERRHEILCAAVERVWRSAEGCGLPTGAAKGRWLVDYVTRTWEELGRPCGERAVSYAVASAERRIQAHDDELAVLVHGDPHQWNALEVPEGGFKLVDPDGLLAEAEYDLGVLMREDPLELLRGDPRRRARRLARRCGLDWHAIWEWGAIERVSTGLVCTRAGMQPVGSQMLAVADRVAG